MSRTKKYSVTGVDADADGLALDQAPAAGTELVLETAAAALSPVRFVTLTSAADLSAINFTIVGYDRWGNRISEVLVGPDTDTVQSLGVYSAITSITPDGTDAADVSAGWPAGGVTPWVLCGRGQGVDQVPVCLVSTLATEGAADGVLEVTYDEFPTLAEPDIDVDSAAIAVTPGTVQTAQGEGVRFVLTTGAGTSVEVKFLRPGPG